MADDTEYRDAITRWGDAREAEGRAAAETEAGERIAELNAALISAREENATLSEDYRTLLAWTNSLQERYDAHMATHEPEPVPVPAVKIGASFRAGESLPAPVESIGIHRYFFQPGDFTRAQTWAGQPNLVKAHDQYGARTFSISLKPDGSSTAFSNPDNIRRFLDTIPEDVDPANVLLTFYHEHDGNIRDGSLTIARYRQGSEQLAAIAHERGHLYGPIHNAMVYDAAKTPKWGLHQHIWEANEADVELYDFWGVDCYSPNYEAPSPRMDPIKVYADTLGLPVLIGELGAPINDPAKQAAWAKAAREWSLTNTRWAMYWSSQVKETDVNWRLTDASAREWFGLQ